MSKLKSLLKGLVSHTVLRRFVFPRWRYNFSAVDLLIICGCINEVKNIEGGVVEVGCEYGETTLFLNNYLDEAGISKSYVCIDTFNGFTERDLDYEVTIRSKARSNLLGFRNNARSWFLKTVRDAGYSYVQVVKADAANFDFTTISPLSFALIDIDLFKPTQACLPAIYEVLTPGGIILVDDCDPSDANYDGAFYAYVEFVQARGLSIDVLGRKLGIIRKAKASSNGSK
jgi:O-methyltransferase